MALNFHPSHSAWAAPPRQLQNLALSDDGKFLVPLGFVTLLAGHGSLKELSELWIAVPFAIPFGQFSCRNGFGCFFPFCPNGHLPDPRPPLFFDRTFFPGCLLCAAHLFCRMEWRRSRPIVRYQFPRTFLRSHAPPQYAEATIRSDTRKGRTRRDSFLERRNKGIRLLIVFRHAGRTMLIRRRPVTFRFYVPPQNDSQRGRTPGEDAVSAYLWSPRNQKP